MHFDYRSTMIEYLWSVYGGAPERGKASLLCFRWDEDANVKEREVKRKMLKFNLKSSV